MSAELCRLPPVAGVPASSLLTELFGADVQTAETTLGLACAPLLPEERAGTEVFVARRLHEFQTGRQCARLALARYGVGPVPIPRGVDRAPIWPEGFVGSISHTSSGASGWCGAAVAQTSSVQSLGLDAEADEPLERGLWRVVLTASELAHLSRGSEEEQGWRAKLIFSAKECAYKCQYPLTRRFLNFQAFDIALDTSCQTFTAVCKDDLGPSLGKGAVLLGRFVRRDGLIATAITLRR
jgi:4'-phosphopantetheinyl transferase EntD